MTAGPAAPVSPARAWLLAARPATLPATVVPVLVGTAAAAGEGARLHPLVFVATLVCALLIQIGTNFANDYSDFYRGADHEGRLGPVRATQSGMISPANVRRGIVAAFGLAVLIGGVLVWIGGWPILVIGALSVLSGLAYTGGPYPFGYYGFGGPFVFVFFGLAAVCGTAYLQTGRWSSFALALSIPVGLLVTNILVVNDLRDLPTDRAAGKRTLAVRIGERATRRQYALFMTLAYVVSSALAATDASRRWLFLPLLTLPLAAALVRRVLGGLAGRELNPLLKQTGQLLLLFGLLLSAALLLVRAR